MKINVLLFASLRESLGKDHVELELPEGSTPRDALEKLELPLNANQLRVAINHHFAEWDTPLNNGDELSFIPPVAGG